MNLNDNSHEFLAKLGNSLQLTTDQVQEILKEEVQGNFVCKIEGRKITSLNIRGLAHAKSSILRKKGIRERVEILDASQIDFSDLINLKNLNFSSRARNDVEIGPYNFKSNPKLEALIFRFHKTNLIDISSCLQLKDLDCSSNRLNSLDTSRNLQLERLNCQFNPLSSLDLSSNENLIYLLANSTDLNNKSLKIPTNNNLSELHLRNTKISEFDPIKFTNLSILSISGLKQGIFDSSLNINLFKLHLSDCDIKKVNIKESFLLSDFVCQDSKIGELTCNEFQAYAIHFLSKKFRLNPSPDQSQVLEILNLHRQAATYNWDEGIKKLTLILKNPNCDVATATMIYWMANPNYYLKYSKINDALEHEKEMFRFINKLEKQILNQEFRNNIIDFDPSEFRGINWIRKSYRKDVSVREIHAKLKSKIIGNTINEFDRNREYTTKL